MGDEVKRSERGMAWIRNKIFPESKACGPLYYPAKLVQ
jgi:hypothetical protein